MLAAMAKAPPHPARPRPATPPPPAPRPRGGDARAIADLVPDVGRAAFRRFGFVQASVVTRWPEIVGTRFARVTAPRAIRFPVGAKSGGTLEIRVESASATMIQHVLPDIIGRVNRFFGYEAVARATLSQGSLSRRIESAADRPPATPAGMALGPSLRAVGDAELATLLGALSQQVAATSGPASPPRLEAETGAARAAPAADVDRSRHDDFF